jgi:hypothetical protein
VYYSKYNITLELSGVYLLEKSHEQAVTMCAIKTSWEKWDWGNKGTQNMIIYRSLINEHKKKLCWCY